MSCCCVVGQQREGPGESKGKDNAHAARRENASRADTRKIDAGKPMSAKGEKRDARQDEARIKRDLDCVDEPGGLEVGNPGSPNVETGPEDIAVGQKRCAARKKRDGKGAERQDDDVIPAQGPRWRDIVWQRLARRRIWTPDRHAFTRLPCR